MFIAHALLRLLLLVLAFVLVVLLLVPAGALAGREIPVGLASTNDQNLRSSQWLYAIRFVPDRDTTVYRFFSQMKAKGASWDEHGGTRCTGSGPGCYGAGDGGTINARLVGVKADGTPDLGNVLAQETVNPRTRYFETKSAYGVSAITLFWYFNMGGASLDGGRPYAMVYRNVHADPTHNFSSTNSPTVKESEAGPNGRNNLDPNAPGAIAGLDPREAVAWSTNGGSSWSWGREVGPYYGDSSDVGTRMPHYGWQSSAAAKPQSNQPYSSYLGTCTPCTLTAKSVPRRTTFTEAGGYAPVGKSVGVVTVRNLRTGQSGRTAALGSGIRKGALSPQVTVEVGDSYEITHTGTVYKAEADGYIVSIFGVGSGAWPFTTAGHGADRAELFASPHPYYDAAPRRRRRRPRPRTRRHADTTITSGPSGTTTSANGEPCLHLERGRFELPVPAGLGQLRRVYLGAVLHGLGAWGTHLRGESHGRRRQCRPDGCQPQLDGRGLAAAPAAPAAPAPAAAAHGRRNACAGYRRQGCRSHSLSVEQLPRTGPRQGAGRILDDALEL